VSSLSCGSGKAVVLESITTRVASSQGPRPAKRPGPKTQRGGRLDKAAECFERGHCLQNY
jgi:hypothetical protein